MGQGYSHTILPAGPIDVPDLVDLTFEKVLGGARFLRTIRARQQKEIQEELEEGKGLGDMIMDQIWEVWHWRKKGDDDE